MLGIQFWMENLKKCFKTIMQEVDSSLIKEVQTNLGKYIKKPPLNEKLLKKPPFRYLHDIITSIIQETGFLEGLFTEDELNSNNVKDKNAKLKFLDKLIAALEKVTRKDVAARSAKIIAGLEVNKTLELLLTIAKAIDNDNKVDCSAIVEEDVKKEAKKAPKMVVPKEKKTIKVNTLKNKGKKTESTVKNTFVSVKNTEKKVPPKDFSVENSYTLEEKEKNQGEGTKEQSIQEPKTSSEPFALNEIHGDEKKGRENEGATPKTSIEKRSVSSGRNSGRNKSSPVRKNSIKGSNARSNSIRNSIEEVSSDALKTRKNLADEHKEQTLEENPIENHANIDEEREKSDNHHVFANEGMAGSFLGSSRDKEKEHSIVQRPSSARPGSRRFSYSNSLQKDDANLAPLKDVKLENKKTDNGKEVHSLPLPKPPNASRPPSARPGAPRIRDRGEVSATDETKTVVTGVNVIEEGKLDQFHDEKENFIVIESERNEPVSINHSSAMNDQEQGKLVDQILKTQKELNDSVAVDASKNKHSEIEWEIGKQRERDIVIKETDKIRNFIQTLTSAANPLGKLFDFLQEDVDEMQRELQHWKKINETLHKQQSAEIEFGKTFLLPLQKQLEEVENSIQEEYLHITNIKHNILINDGKILKLLSNTNKTRTK